jgi:hypothetical protein
LTPGKKGLRGTLTDFMGGCEGLDSPASTTGFVSVTSIAGDPERADSLGFWQQASTMQSTEVIARYRFIEVY